METISYIAPKTEVYFKTLSCSARVNYVKIDLGNTLLYNICFYTDGQPRFVDVYDDEIRAIPQ